MARIIVPPCRAAALLMTIDIPIVQLLVGGTGAVYANADAAVLTPAGSWLPG
jgi:hypothetical protein